MSGNQQTTATTDGSDDAVMDIVDRAYGEDHLRDCMGYKSFGEWPCDCIIGDLCDEVERLRRWKVEATEVADMWEDVWVALGRPGELGEFKPVAALRTVLNRSGEAS